MCTLSEQTCGWRLAGVVWIAALALFLAGVAGAIPAAGRVVAIGDVHGAYGPLVEILRTAQLIDDSGRWVGGESVLVQTGDLVERGPHVKEVLDLLMALQPKAEGAGGRVVVLLGNHEVTTLLAYLDYKSTPPEIYERIFAAFTDETSEERRTRAFKQWNRWRTRFPNCGNQSKAEWEASHPPGFVEYFEALSPTGPYGRWLRSLPTAERIGTTLFTHAGPSPWLVEQGLTSVYMVNRAVTREIEAFDAARSFLIGEDIVLPFFTLSEIYCAVTEELVRTPDQSRPARYYVPLTAEQRGRLVAIRESLPAVETSMTLRREGPLWYRGYAELGAAEGRQIVDKVLGAFGASSLVVAHSTVKGQIKQRLGKVYFIDTGMVYSGAAGGRPAALEIDAAGFTALYPGEVTRLARHGPEAEASSIHEIPEPPGRRWLAADAKPLPLTSAREIEEFLRSAPVVAREPLTGEAGRASTLLLEQYGMRAHAIFTTIDEEERNRRLPSGEVVRFFVDSYRNEIAAYRLGQILGMRGLHPAVEREIDGVVGSVQLRHEDVISEDERTRRDLHPPDRLAWRRQIDDVRIFDNLINNFDRNKSNLLISPDWLVWPVDHSRSFGLEPEIPDPEDVERCSRTLWDRVGALDREVVTRELGAVLREAEIDALFQRRDALVERLREMFSQFGEESVLFDSAVDDPYSPRNEKNLLPDPA